jgi:hypothetical protein
MATKSNGYEAYRKAQLEDGLLYQDFIVSVAWQAGIAIVQYASKTYQLKVGESRGGFEIKHDKKLAATRNLYIETAEKARPRPGEYAPSGIMRDGHWMYVIGDYDVVYFLPNNLLRALFIATSSAGKPRYSRTQTETSQGFLLPERDAKKYAALTLRPAAGGKMTQIVADVAALAKQIRAAMDAVPNQLRLFDDQEPNP